MAEGPALSDGQRGLGLFALAAAGVAAVIGSLLSAGLLAAPFLAAVGLAAVPQALKENPRAYARAVLLVGWLLVAWSAAGAVIGMFLFLPAALLLLAAAFVTPGNRPGLSWSLVVPAVTAASFCAVVVAPPSDERDDPPPCFRATVDRPDRDRELRIRIRQGDLGRYGGHRTEILESAGHLRLVVRFSEDLPPEGRTRLNREIGLLPGVVSVRPCTSRTDWARPPGQAGMPEGVSVVDGREQADPSRTAHG